MAHHPELTEPLGRAPPAKLGEGRKAFWDYYVLDCYAQECYVRDKYGVPLTIMYHYLLGTIFQPVLN